jgi:hypothetical protein
MECHRRIHKENGFYDRMNPVECPDHEIYENFVVGLIGSSERSFDEFIGEEVNEKFVAYRDNSGNCEEKLNSGEVCRRDLPCQYHGNKWTMEPIT